MEDKRSVAGRKQAGNVDTDKADLPGKKGLNIQKVDKLLFTEPSPYQEIVTFNGQYLKDLSPKQIEQLEKIFTVDPFFTGGRPGEKDGKVVSSTPNEALELINKYIHGGVYKDFEGGGIIKLEALDSATVKSLTAMIAWYVSYRRSFPDPTETESMSNILTLLKDTKNGNASWDICVLPTKEGGVAAAFSGQALDVKVKNRDVGGQIKAAWGEHIFVDPELREKGYGAKILQGFAEKLGKQFGPRDMVVIEVDNPFGLKDYKDPVNGGFFDHSDPQKRGELWTDPQGDNMAMDPFRRMRVWDRLGFYLMAVKRSDLASPTATPYIQIPLDKGGEPCETIILAVRPTPEMKEKIESGKVTAIDINRIYGAMMATVSEDYRKDPSYQAVQRELKELESVRIRLVRFYTGEGKAYALNPEAVQILKDTAGHKFLAG